MAATVTLTIPDPRRARARWLLLGLAVVGLLAVTTVPSFSPRPSLAADATNPEHTISVSGTGRVVLSPDTADVRLGVTLERPTVRQARQDAAKAMDAIVASIKHNGVPDKDLTTSVLSLQPTYDYSAGTQARIRGYQFTNALAVTVRNLNKVGDVVDDAIAAGATSLDGVTFRVDDHTKAEAQARSAAMVDARAKADALAAAARVSIAGVSSISETVAPVPYPVYFGAAQAGAVDKSVATPIQPGTSEVSVTVVVVYRIP